MGKYALIQDYKVEKIVEIGEEEACELSMRYQNVIDVNELAETPQAGWAFDGRMIVKPLSIPLTPDAYVKSIVIPSAKDFAKQLEIDFISENILMGISQLGKTSGVLGVLTKRVPVAGSSEPVSMTDTIRAQCPSLTVTIQVIDYHIAHIEDYTGLSPFITTSRLQTLKTKIKAYLGIP